MQMMATIVIFQLTIRSDVYITAHYTDCSDVQAD